MIAAALLVDQGITLLKASNAYAQNVVSPGIQTRAVPVTITDPSLPADLTVTAGAAVNVATAGSQPISYQWFKDGLALADATNQTYDIAGRCTGSRRLCRTVAIQTASPLRSPAARPD